VPRRSASKSRFQVDHPPLLRTILAKLRVGDFTSWWMVPQETNFRLATILELSGFALRCRNCHDPAGRNRSFSARSRLASVRRADYAFNTCWSTRSALPPAIFATSPSDRPLERKAAIHSGSCR
jgi:hypothetical protein